MSIELLPSDWYRIGHQMKNRHYFPGAIYRFGERLIDMTENLTDAELLKIYVSREEAEWTVKYHFGID